MVKQFRQGDVFVHPSTIPNGAVQLREKKIILALGEATGHHHRIMVEDVPNVEAYEKDGVMYLRVLEGEPAILEHEEHAPIVIPPGEYSVTIQREYTPGEIRRVID